MAYDPSIKTALDQAAKNISILLGASEIGSEQALDEVGAEFVQRMRDMLSHEGTGVIYPGMPSQSSAPGEPPAPQTGDYRDSWQHKTGRDARGFYVDCFTTVEYGPYLEYGTRYMEPRPHVRPVTDEMRTELTVKAVAAVGAAQRAAIGRLREVAGIETHIRWIFR